MSKLLPIAREFQSEARQVDEQRPPASERVVLYMLVAVIACGITWASIAKVDRIVVAQGKLVTTAATIVVQPLETSVVRTLNAKIGDVVQKGDPLAALDPTFSMADAAQLRGKIASLDAQIARLNAEIADKPYAPELIDDEARLQLAIWTQHVGKYRAKLESFDKQISETEARIATKTADHEALKPRLVIARELENMRRELFKKEVGTKIAYLDAQAQRMQIERDMQLAANECLELQQTLNRLNADKAAYVAEFRQQLGEDLVQARRDRDAAAKQLEKAARRNEVTVLEAPADAIVLDVAQRSVGSVMKEAEPLYTLVPLNSPLEAEVLVEGRDVGQVKTASLTKVKLEAWPFQKHGTLEGEVRTLSEDVFSPDPKKDAEARPHYKARIKLTSAELRNVPDHFRLIPGMAVTAEIKSGDRSVMSYFLYPLLRVLDESIREP
ncbi:HlyD family type I secretion periplasmic adaptor subunit [Bradyrhizobium sp. ARR65]|uniref:HlyD family type I secretion periplasmic adaptor subunit n=1 Tax=Bradyrhizobium sp. ARR65 TaxID=1040989 RepID=UPI000466804B|nr:HlyD family type I secretion periplasmic adaptor subunit [Bradyrhizobium sp. ARR65]